MTQAEALTLLEKRLGWKDDKTVESITLSANNILTDSGHFFNDEHPAITLQNIYECQPRPNITEADFQAYLDDLRKQCVRQVIGDAFEKDYIDQTAVKAFVTGFDRAISLKMTIKVSELIMTAARSGRIKRFGDEFVGKLNYDIFREAPNKFAIRGANYSHTMGVATKYDGELESIRRRFGNIRNMARTITKGQAFDESLTN